MAAQDTEDPVTVQHPNHSAVDFAQVIGTGPFILTRWDPGEGISCVRNPDFFGSPERPYLDSYVWVQTFQDPNAYRIAFEQKQVDSMTDPDPNTILAIHDDRQDETYLTFQGVANTVAIFTPSNKPPWNDLRLTRAIDLAVNRRQLIQQLHNGFGKVSGPVSWMQDAWAISQEDMETIPGYRIDKDADIEEARALWNAAGGPDIGQIDWVTSELWAARAAWSATPGIIAEMFNRAFDTDQFNGITKPYLEIIPSWLEHDFDPFFSWIPNIEIPDARADMIGAFTTGAGSNYLDISDPYIDETLLAAKQELDYETAFQMIRDVQDYVMERGSTGARSATTTSSRRSATTTTTRSSSAPRKAGTSWTRACRRTSSGSMRRIRRSQAATRRRQCRSDPKRRRAARRRPAAGCNRRRARRSKRPRRPKRCSNTSSAG